MFVFQCVVGKGWVFFLGNSPIPSGIYSRKYSPGREISCGTGSISFLTNFVHVLKKSVCNCFKFYLFFKKYFFRNLKKMVAWYIGSVYIL